MTAMGRLRSARPERKSQYSAPSDHGGASMDDVLIRTSNPWNKGKLIGQKAPFKLKEIWAIRVRLQIYARTRELALFDLGIDSKLRGCDLVKLQVRDIAHGDRIAARAIVVQKKTSRPVQFEITEPTRSALAVVRAPSTGKPQPRYIYPRKTAIFFCTAPTGMGGKGTFAYPSSTRRGSSSTLPKRRRIHCSGIPALRRPSYTRSFTPAGSQCWDSRCAFHAAIVLSGPKEGSAR